MTILLAVYKIAIDAGPSKLVPNHSRVEDWDAHFYLQDKLFVGFHIYLERGYWNIIFGNLDSQYFLNLNQIFLWYFNIIYILI